MENKAKSEGWNSYTVNNSQCWIKYYYSCPQCGARVENYGWGIVCGVCGYLFNYPEEDKMRDLKVGNITFEPKTNYGWICPICGRVNNPSALTCLDGCKEDGEMKVSYDSRIKDIKEVDKSE